MLKIGDKAPDFKAVDGDGRTVALSDYKGKKLVIYFYPKDNTPGCTAEACDLRDNYHRFQAAGYEILGVSKDSEKSHRGFAEKYSLPFRLVADTDTAILQAYDAWGEKSLYGKKYMGALRKTYVIDEHGVITDIIDKVNTKAHSAQILK
ncbi:MAG: thioredoxin-dependent thiol peroxidase [Flavobacteriales bacterium]|jgi:peroxiredoxin|nr:thioredoxin-dependent thiol peroxidase [Flavobacteriales bacterium]PWM12504.1 MAG: thioredoxin-dependent thiol peroxidase [Flavobacteriales bacterium]